MNPSPPNHPILTLVAKDFGIPESDLFIQERKVRIVEPRHVAIYLLYHSGMTLWEIGFMFLQHSSSVSNALNTVRDRLETEPKYLARLQRLKDSLHVTAH